MESIVQISLQEHLQVGATNRNCLKVLPTNAKIKQQKFAIGDDSGSVKICGFTKGEAAIESKSESLEREIQRLDLAMNPQNERELIFYCGGISIRGMSRKGTNFFAYDTNLTETIRAISVEGSQIWTAGEYLVYEFQSKGEKMSETNYYLSQDKINDFYVHSIKGDGIFNPILACQDNSIKVLDGDRELYHYSTIAPVVQMLPFQEKYASIVDKRQASRQLLYGLANGSLISLNMTSQQPFPVWSNRLSQSGVSLFGIYDFRRSGKSDLLVARDDSSLELLGFNLNNELEVLATKMLNERVTGIDSGFISNAAYCEFIISTYSGRILGVCDADNKFKNAQVANTTGSSAAGEQEKKLQALKLEIAKLESSLEQMSNTGNTATSGAQQLPGAQEVEFKLSHKLTVDENDASYSLQIDSQHAIEYVALQSQMRMEIVDVDKSLAVSRGGMDAIDPRSSKSPADPENDNYLLATYKIAEPDIKNFQIKLRASEGRKGEIQVFVFPLNFPLNCQMIKAELKPLSLHYKCSETVPLNALPWNTLTLIGDFSPNDVHIWLKNVLPNLPHAPDEENTNLTYVFKSIFTGTLLHIELKQKLAVFRSDSISTIQIVKEQILQEVNVRSITIDIKWDCNDQSVERVLELLQDKFEQHKLLYEQHRLLPALRELKLQDAELDLISEDYFKILQNEKSISEEYAKLPKKIEFLKGIITDLYCHRAALAGQEVQKEKLEKLEKLIDNFQIDQILAFFKQSKNI